jgi:hypothetical protein
VIGHIDMHVDKNCMGSCLPNGLHGISPCGTTGRVLKLLASLNEIRAAHVPEKKELYGLDKLIERITCMTL